METRLPRNEFAHSQFGTRRPRPIGHGGLGDRLIARLESASRYLAASCAAEAEAYAMWSRPLPPRGTRGH